MSYNHETEERVKLLGAPVMHPDAGVSHADANYAEAYLVFLSKTRCFDFVPFDQADIHKD